MSENKNRSLELAVAGVIVLAAAGLRLWAASGDLWLDEIWSLDQLAQAHGLDAATDWLDLFFHDNTHPLNTL